MKQFRSIAFGIVASLILLCFLLYAAMDYVGTVEGQERSTLEGRKYQSLPKLSLQTLANHSFQDDFEGFVSDHIPSRDNVMLDNAALQRFAIRLANAPLGFPGYPTFFGSGYAYLSASDAVVEIPKNSNAVSVKSINRAVDAYSRLINNNPQINWVFCMPERSSTTAALPLHDMVSNPADSTFYRESLLDKLPDKCTVIQETYPDVDSFFSDYFRTDHHWQIEGALRAYGDIMRTFGKQPYEFDEVYTAFEGPFWGSNARSGLCPERSGDTVRDVRYTDDDLSVTLDGEAQNPAYLDEGLGDNPDLFSLSNRFDNAYAQWFHESEKRLITITNDSVENGSLLVVGDSFSNNLGLLFAKSYRTVWLINPRYDTINVSEFISNHQIDDALIILNQSFIISDGVIKSLS